MTIVIIINHQPPALSENPSLGTSRWPAGKAISPLNPLSPDRFDLKAIPRALRAGWASYRAMPGPSLAWGGLIALIALGLLAIPFILGAPALILILAGGFALIGPLLLPGFFALHRSLEQGQPPGLALIWQAYRQAGAGFWALAGACLFLLLVWITDAGILYAFLIGMEPAEAGGSWTWAGAWAAPGVRSFALWASLLGAVMAAGIHLIAGFAVPLLVDGRAPPVPAIHASVRALFLNPIPALLWALILILGLVTGLLLPPLLPLFLPVLAYAHHDLYRLVFPNPETGGDRHDDSPRRQP